MYDLKKMNYDPDATKLFGMFLWRNAPEGYSYWSNLNYAFNRNALPTEAEAKLAEMRDQYEREKRPAVGVLHDWDGGSMSPVPVGTDRTVWTSGGGIYRDVSTHLTCWDCVTQYLVHSYPEPKRIAGTVAEYTDTPDFTTWVADPK